jgi:localization factor PodJL
MRPDLPWNVAGIPSEAREAARAAARREGLSIGEWLTRRILAGLSDMSEPQEPHRDGWSGYRSEDRGAARRDSDEMLDRVSRSETEAAGVYRRIEEQLRGVGRRLDAAERSQSESNREMSKAAVELNITAREQAQAFDQIGSHVVGISERLERVERNVGSEGLRDAVKALHQGLSRLADQITETANRSATQISSLSGNLETLAGRLGQVRKESQTSTQNMESSVAAFDERLRTVEKAAQANAGGLERALEALEVRQSAAKDNSADAIARLEESVGRLETRGADPALDRRLSGIERALSEIVGRIDHGGDEVQHDSVEVGLQKLTQRLDAAEAAQRAALEEMRKGSAVKAEPKPPEPFPTFAEQAAPFSAPPFPEANPLFADPGFVPPPVPPPAYDMATGFGAEQPFAAGQGFAAESPLPPPTVDSYLSAARRSARAASQAEAERGMGSFAGFGWNSSARAAAPRSGRTLYLGIGVLALVAIAVIAGAILSQRTAGEVPAISAIGALFEKKPAPPPIKTETSPADDNSAAAPAAPATNQQTAPPVQKQDVKPAPVHMVPAPAAAATPSSPQIAPQKIVPVPQKTVAAPQAVTQKPPVSPAPPPAATKAPPASTAPLDRLTVLANAGNAKAELIVALKYLDGDGVPADDKEAAKWLARAADGGEPVAQYRLGTVYERGRGVPADAAKAVHWYQAAANQGNRKAMHNLAVAYAEGSGVKKDFTEASRWFSRAANLGLSDSQFNLAVLYERGLGVPQSPLNAYKWYAIAAAQGDTESKARLQVIATQLSADDRAAAQHAADAFKPSPLDPRANVAPTMAEALRK